MLSACGFAVNAVEKPLAEISGDGVITVNGITEESPGTKVMFMIVRPRFDNANLNSIEIANEAIEDVYQGNVSDEGTFTYSYTLDANSKSGYYLVSVKVSGENLKRTQLVLFKNMQKLNEAVQKINDGESVFEIIDIYKDDIDCDTAMLYENTTIEQKNYITGSIKAPVTAETLVSQFKEYTDLACKLLSNSSVKKEDIKVAIEEQYEKIGFTTEDYEKYDKLSNSRKEVAVAYMFDNYNNINKMSDFLLLYNKGISYAKNNADNNSSSTGGGGSGGGSIMSPVTDGIYGIEPPAKSIYFDDIEQAEWAKDAISKLAELKIVNGKADRIFAPNDPITREEFVAIVVRAFEITKNSNDIVFEDVLSNAWYYDAVKKAYNSGIVTGIDDKTFGIGQLITRQDMAVIISRAVSYSSMELYPVYTDKELKDMDIVSDYASSAVSEMVKAGVVNGYEDGSFKPQNQATRAQAAKIIYSILFK